MVQNLLVGLIVVVAAAYALWILMPAHMRRAGAAALAAMARRCGLGEQESQQLRATLASHSSCGVCDGCKGCARPAESVMRRPGGRGASRPE